MEIIFENKDKKLQLKNMNKYIVCAFPCLNKVFDGTELSICVIPDKWFNDTSSQSLTRRT